MCNAYFAHCALQTIEVTVWHSAKLPKFENQANNDFFNFWDITARMKIMRDFKRSSCWILILGYAECLLCEEFAFHYSAMTMRCSAELSNFENQVSYEIFEILRPQYFLIKDAQLFLLNLRYAECSLCDEYPFHNNVVTIWCSGHFALTFDIQT